MPVHCIYGTETDTDEAYIYDVDHFTNSTPPAPKIIISGPGDGTVNLLSLQSCERLGPQVCMWLHSRSAHHVPFSLAHLQSSLNVSPACL